MASPAKTTFDDLSTDSLFPASFYVAGSARRTQNPRAACVPLPFVVISTPSRRIARHRAPGAGRNDELWPEPAPVKVVPWCLESPDPHRLVFCGLRVRLADGSMADPDLGLRRTDKARNCHRRRQHVMQRSARHEQQTRLELIVDRLRKWCQQSRGNLEWAAKQLEVDQSAVSRWVSGRERPRGQCKGY